MNEIERLAGIYHDKREYVNMLGMMNIVTKYDKRREQVIEYEKAKAEMFAADRELRLAQNGLAK